jgi:hypothetical protein
MLEIVGSLFPETVAPQDYGHASGTPIFTPEEHDAAAQRGSSEAIRRCGDWPRSGTLREYEASIIRAEHEAEFSLDLWARWTRHGRPQPEGKRLELCSIRLQARHQVASHIAEVRQLALDLLTAHRGHA